MFQAIAPFSPIEQHFVWNGEYLNGTSFSEFDMETKEENSFYDIKKDELVRFGLVGNGNKLYFEVFGGTFKLNGQMYEFLYEVDGKECYLTGQNQRYNDIIQYKDAEKCYNPIMPEQEFPTIITQHSFGYKTEINFDQMKMYFKAIVHLPLDGSNAYISLHLVSDKDVDGTLKIRKNSEVIDEYTAPLKANIGGEMNWMVK